MNKPGEKDELLDLLYSFGWDMTPEESYAKIMQWYANKVADQLSQERARAEGACAELEEAYKNPRGAQFRRVEWLQKELAKEQAKVERLREVAVKADLMRVHLPHLEKYYKETQGMVLTASLKRMPDEAKQALKGTETK